MTRFSPAKPSEAPIEYAKRLCEEAKTARTDVEGEIEGARLVATPKASYSDVFEAWSSRRREISRRGFDEELRALANLLVGRRVLSVSAEFDPMRGGADRITITVDDGSRLTVHGAVFAMWKGENKTPPSDDTNPGDPGRGNC